ncbi:MAG TPA: PP2C family protein-serine/threonine phosphatase, partial [Rubricoccaceae bacterium]
PPPAVRRALGALVATAPRRAAGWTAVALAFASVAAARVAYALVGLAPSSLTAVGLDVLAVAAVAAGYAIAAQRAPGATPLRALYGLLAAAAGLAALEWGVGAAADGGLRPGGLADGLETVGAGAGLGVAEAALVVALGLGLRPLVLYRRGRLTVALWRTAAAAALVAALAWSGRPADVPPSGPAVALDAVAVALGLALVLRQRWVAALVGRQRLGAAALAFALAAALVGLLALRSGAAGGMPVYGAGGAEQVPYSYVLSRSLGSLATLAMGFGALYGLTAGLVLVFQLPAAEPTRAGERRAFQSIAGFSGRLLDRPALAAAVARGPVEAGLAEAAWVVLSDPSAGDLAYRVAAAEGLDAATAEAAVDADALVRAAAEGARAGRPALVLGRAEADHRVHARPGSGLGSLVVLPLLDAASPADGADAAVPGGPPRGALLAARRTPDAFEADDVAALDAFAAQAALALAHADLIAGAIDRERLARELALARDVQRRLFPQTLPDVPGLDIAADERPALEVGGDYYDAVRLGPGCAGVVVADVSGKGAAAAFHMAEMKGVFQVGARLTRAPVEFLCSASEALAPSLPRGTFVSAVYAVVDADAGTLAIARAGHCPPVLARDAARPDGGEWLLRGRGVALGLGSQALFERTLDEQHVRLAPGDAVVLYTDGLVEARDAAGEEWGYVRLLAAVAAQRGGSARALLDAVLAEQRRWSATPDAPADDVTVVVLKWTGTDATTPGGSRAGPGPPLTLPPP